MYGCDQPLCYWVARMWLGDSGPSECCSDMGDPSEGSAVSGVFCLHLCRLPNPLPVSRVDVPWVSAQLLPGGAHVAGRAGRVRVLRRHGGAV